MNLWVPGDLKADLNTTGAAFGDADYGRTDGNVTSADLNYYINFGLAHPTATSPCPHNRLSPRPQRPIAAGELR